MAKRKALMLRHVTLLEVLLLGVKHLAVLLLEVVFYLSKPDRHLLRTQNGVKNAEWGQRTQNGSAEWGSGLR